MNIQEKFEKLIPEQREKLQSVKTEQDLDAFLAEIAFQPTAEERAMLSLRLKAKNSELTDDELEEAAGGSGFKKCPLGHYEYWFPQMTDCTASKCDYYSEKNSGKTLHCGYFNCSRSSIFC